MKRVTQPMAEFLVICERLMNEPGSVVNEEGTNFYAILTICKWARYKIGMNFVRKWVKFAPNQDYF